MVPPPASNTKIILKIELLQILISLKYYRNNTQLIKKIKLYRNIWFYSPGVTNVESMDSVVTFIANNCYIQFLHLELKGRLGIPFDVFFPIPAIPSEMSLTSLTKTS